MLFKRRLELSGGCSNYFVPVPKSGKSPRISPDWILIFFLYSNVAYSIDFDDIWLRYWQNIGKICYRYG